MGRFEDPKTPELSSIKFVVVVFLCNFEPEIDKAQLCKDCTSTDTIFTQNRGRNNTLEYSSMFHVSV